MPVSTCLIEPTSNFRQETLSLLTYKSVGFTLYLLLSESIMEENEDQLINQSNQMKKIK